MKYVGVFIDDKLNWQPHIEYLCKKLSKISGMIYKVRKYLGNKPLLSQLHYAPAHSHIHYGITVWGKASKKYINSLYVIQNRLLRATYFSGPRVKLSALYTKCEVLPIPMLYKHEVAQLVYKFKHNMLLYNYTNYLLEVNSMHQYSTRSSNHKNYFTPRVHKLKSVASNKIIGPQIWNELPPNITTASNLKTFLKLTQKYLLTKFTNSSY